jgi:hypothetical protein
MQHAEAIDCLPLLADRGYTYAGTDAHRSNCQQFIKSLGGSRRYCCIRRYKHHMGQPLHTMYSYELEITGEVGDLWLETRYANLTDSTVIKMLAIFEEQWQSMVALIDQNKQGGQLLYRDGDWG